MQGQAATIEALRAEQAASTHVSPCSRTVLHTSSGHTLPALDCRATSRERHPRPDPPLLRRPCARSEGV